MKNTIIIKNLPVLLNTLYIPVIKWVGKQPVPSLVKNKDAKDFEKLVKVEGIRQKCKVIKGQVSVKCDVLVKDRKNFDIDGVFKLMFDALEGVAFENDRDIVEIIARKHLDAEYNGLHLCIESFKGN